MSAPPGQIAQLRDDALESLDGIEHELKIAHLNRQIYDDFRDEFVARHPDADATFLNSYSGLYARGQVMVIRRLADQHRDKPDSLWWLVERIKRNPTIGSRDALRQLLRDDGHDVDDRTMVDRLATTEVPAAAHLESLQDTLASELGAVLAFADKHVAHRDPRGAAQPVTYGDIHTALDKVTDVANVMSRMLRGATVSYDLIAIQGDWHACFRPAMFPIGMDAYAWPDPRGFI